MGAAPESSSSVVARPPCDVFINHRGGDTRRNIASLLDADMCKRKIPTYIDDRLDKGDEIEPLLMEGIEISRVAVFIFSEKYAYSKWCLHELVETMACKKTEQIFKPVFLEIDPSLFAQRLGYLHASDKQIIYRDFKASNILLDVNYNAKLSDFGLAKFRFHGDTESMAHGRFSSNNKDELTSKLINNAIKEGNETSEDPEAGFTMNASICQSQSPTKGNNHDDDPNPFGLSGSILRSQHKRKENMGKFCSSLATLTFPLFMLLTNLGHPLKETQGSFISLLVSLLAMFDLIAFIFAVSVMILVRWRFTWLQIAIMLISAMAIRVAHSNLVISVLFMFMEAPILAIIYLLWNS